MPQTPSVFAGKPVVRRLAIGSFAEGDESADGPPHPPSIEFFENF